jgi:hypothetical protein
LRPCGDTADRDDHLFRKDLLKIFIGHLVREDDLGLFGDKADRKDGNEENFEVTRVVLYILLNSNWALTRWQ